jgi:signal transduction histidine kinase/CheY-like chemotaxis protein
VGRSWFDTCLPADEREDVRSYFNKLMSEGGRELMRHENAVITAMGERRQISWRAIVVYDAEGKPSGALSSGQDVTDAVELRKSMELALQQWERTFNGMRDCIALLDAEGRILRANAAMNGLMKEASRSDWHGMKCVDIMHAGERPAECPFALARKTLKREKMVLRHKNRAFEVTVDPLIVDGVFSGAVHVMSDITEQEFLHEELSREHEDLQKAMDELKRTHIRLVAQERMNALVRMASGIAHEINNLLSPILGFSELLIAAPDILKNSDEAMSMIRDIHTAALDARQVMRRLRELYRPQDREVRVPINLIDVLDGAISLTSTKWQNETRRTGATIDIKKRYSEPVVISGNEAELREMFINLILNSVDAMSGGGEIEFTVQPVGDFAEVRVRDTGCGIPESMMPHLFTVFRTTKAEDGSGLGLAVVQKIVSQHEGTVSISSREGQGTVVTISLPLNKDALPSLQQPAKITAASRRALVLIVDDDDKVRAVVKHYVKRLGYNVVEAASGQAALDIVKIQDIELLITDMAMAGMNGAELAAAAKSIRPMVPVILYTGFGDIMLAEEQRPPGVDLILGKPVTIHELSRAMLSLLKV